MKIVSAFVASLVASTAWGFAPVAKLPRAPTVLASSARQDAQYRQTVSSVLAAAFVAMNVATSAAPALAMDQTRADEHLFGSSAVIAARSGGRSGGRAASGGNSKAYRSSSSPARSSTTYKSYSSTTYVAPPSPTVVVSPGYSYGYSSYNPIGDAITGYALGSAINSIGNGFREPRQEREIEQSRYQLEQARMKEAELEGRLRALEAQQQAPVRAP